MNRATRIVIKFEVIRQLKKPSFWIALLLLPLLILGIVGFSALMGYNSESALEEMWGDFSDKKIALTDDASIIANTPNPDGTDNTLPSNYIILDDKSQGIAAVQSGEIDIYYYIPADFLESNTIELHAKTEDGAIFSNFEPPLRSILSMSAAATTPPENLIILTNSYQFTSTTYNAEGKEVNLFGQAILPMATLVIFYVLICVFGNRLLMAVTEEKENRISEMILTAVSAKNLIVGKIIALILLGFLQIAVFVIPLLCLIYLNRGNAMIAGVLSSIEVNPFIIITNIILLLFSYFFFTGASTLVGSLVPTAREASQYIGVVMVGLVSPLFFINSFFATNPDGIAYFFSYFPLSAPMALMLRNAFGSLPPHELIIGLIELGICSAIVLRLTAKSFQKNAINFSIAKPTFKIRKSWKKN